MKKSFFIRLSFFVALLCVGIPIHTWAVGVTPSLTTIDHFANGISADRTIYLTRSSTEEPSLFKVSMNGYGSKYIEVKSNHLEFGREEKQAPFVFTLKPETAPAGEYAVTFTFVSVPEEGAKSEGTVLSIGVGAVAEVRFTIVNEQIEQFEVLDIGLDPAEEDQPIVFQYQLRNTGNVDARPFRVAFTITDQTDPTHVITEVFTGEDIPFVVAAQTQSFVFKLKTPVPQGRYYVKIAFFDKNNVLMYEKNTMALIVFPPGTLAQSAGFEDVSLNGDLFEPNELMKFDFKIKNDGDLIIKPIPYIELKTEDGQTLDLLRAEEKVIPRAQSALYTLTTRIAQKGKYTANVYFDYGIKRSETKTFEFRIAPKTVFSELKPVHYGAGAAVIVIGGSSLLLFRRKKKGASLKLKTQHKASGRRRTFGHKAESRVHKTPSVTTEDLFGGEPPASPKV